MVRPQHIPSKAFPNKLPRSETPVTKCMFLYSYLTSLFTILRSNFEINIEGYTGTRTNLCSTLNEEQQRDVLTRSIECPYVVRGQKASRKDRPSLGALALSTTIPSCTTTSSHIVSLISMRILGRKLTPRKTPSLGWCP